MSEPAEHEAARLAEWLEGLRLGQYAEAFTQNHVTLETLRQLSNDDLKECGVSSLGHRKILLAEIQKLPGEPAPPATLPASPTPVALPRPPFVPAPPEASWVAPVLPLAPSAAPATPERRRFWRRLLASKFLVVSVLAHLLFGMGATYFIVQRSQAKRKVTFQGGPANPSASKRALEHKVSMAQKKKSGGAPPQAKRIATTGLSRIALPDMPSMPTATNVVPGMAAGMGGAGFGQGMGFGSGMGSGMGGNGGSGTFSFFGFRGGTGGGFPGTLYDLKQTKGHQETPIGQGPPSGNLYPELIRKFAKEGFRESIFASYYKAPNPLYATQFMIPSMDAQEGPKAYGVDKEVKPSRWCAIYKGKVSPPKTATYRFVGAADDLILVKFNGKQVLDGSWIPMSDHQPDGAYKNGYGNHPRGFCKSKPLQVTAGEWYEMEVIIGEHPGGFFFICLCIEEEGVQYKKDGGGHPLLPLFRVANTKIPPDTQKLPPFDPEGPVWKIQAAGSGSLLDALKR